MCVNTVALNYRNPLLTLDSAYFKNYLQITALIIIIISILCYVNCTFLNNISSYGARLLQWNREYRLSKTLNNGLDQHSKLLILKLESIQACNSRQDIESNIQDNSTDTELDHQSIEIIEAKYTTFLKFEINRIRCELLYSLVRLNSPLVSSSPMYNQSTDSPTIEMVNSVNPIRATVEEQMENQEFAFSPFASHTGISHSTFNQLNQKEVQIDYINSTMSSIHAINQCVDDKLLSMHLDPSPEDYVIIDDSKNDY